LPGGRPEEGEDHAQTLAREFMEELSIKISMSAPLDSYLFEVIPGRHVLSPMAVNSSAFTADSHHFMKTRSLEFPLAPASRS
jgi:8-oxo-dGTP pyrophosphatase MutT (NUDIX family)